MKKISHRNREVDQQANVAELLQIARKLKARKVLSPMALFAIDLVDALFCAQRERDALTARVRELEAKLELKPGEQRATIREGVKPPFVFHEDDE